MCYPSPGPRCSAHVAERRRTAARRLALAELRADTEADAVSFGEGTPGLLDALSGEAFALRSELDRLEDVWLETAAGQAEAAAEIRALLDAADEAGRGAGSRQRLMRNAARLERRLAAGMGRRNWKLHQLRERHDGTAVLCEACLRGGPSLSGPACPACDTGSSALPPTGPG